MSSTASSLVATRSDAVANRERILETAALVVNRRGPQVPMAEFARAAGVGVGTLYRHFASREDLIAALQLQAFESICEVAREAEGQGGTALQALDRFFRGIIALRDRIVLPLHGGPPLASPETAERQREVRAVLQEILDRDDGSIRAGVSPFDLIMTGAMLSQPLPHAGDWDEVGPRLAGLFLRGLSCPDDPLAD